MTKGHSKSVPTQPESNTGIFGSEPEYYKYLVEVMGQYQCMAKECVRLSTLALMLPIFFARNILGIAETKPIVGHIPWFMYPSWILLVLAIVGGLIFQHLTVRWVDDYGEGRPEGIPQKITQYVYFCMCVMFVLGIIFFGCGVVWPNTSCPFAGKPN